MTGSSSCAEIKAAQPTLAALIISGHSSFDYAVTAMRAGADDYMTKPVDPSRWSRRRASSIAVTRERARPGSEVVLAVGAHPDDVEIGVGGILLRHAAQGHEVTVLTLSGGEQGGVGGRPRRRVPARRGADVGARSCTPTWPTRASARAARRSPRSRPSSTRSSRRRLHAHVARRPPGPPQRHSATLVAAARHPADVLLPGALHHRRVQADALRGHRRVPRAQARGHPRLRVAGRRSAATSTRSCCAPPRATGRASARRATSSRSRWCARATPPRPASTGRNRGGAPMPLTAPRVLVTGAGGPSGHLDPARHGRRAADDARRRHRPVRRRPLPRRRRRGASILPRGDDPGFSDALLEQLPARVGRRRRADGRHRAAAAGARPRAVRRVGVRARARLRGDAARPAWTSGCWPSAAASTCACPDTWSSTTSSTPPRSTLPVIVKPRSGSGSRGIRLDRAPRRAGGARARRHAARAGAPARPGVLARRARARRRARRRAWCRASA